MSNDRRGDGRDGRDFVKKVVDRAVRQIGKRNLVLNEKVTALVYRLKGDPDRAVHWIGSDASRKPRHPAVIERPVSCKQE